MIKVNAIVASAFVNEKGEFKIDAPHSISCRVGDLKGIQYVPNTDTLPGENDMI